MKSQRAISSGSAGFPCREMEMSFPERASSHCSCADLPGPGLPFLALVRGFFKQGAAPLEWEV
jgi:hypothetical protein